MFITLLSLDSYVVLLFPAVFLNFLCRLPPSGRPLSINSDCVVGAEYLEREPSKLYPGCSTMHSYRPFPLGYQDAPPTPGIPPQRGFRHVSCSHYHGGSLVSPSPDSIPESSLPQLLLLPLWLLSSRKLVVKNDVPLLGGLHHWTWGSGMCFSE